MLTFRVEHPETGIGPYRNDDPRAHFEVNGLKGFAKLLEHHGPGSPPPWYMSDDDKVLFGELIDQGGPDNPHPWQELVRARSSGDLRMMEHLSNRPNVLSYEKSGRQGILTKRGVVFGFSSRGDFDRWWGKPELKELLDKYGYKEAVYSVPDERVACFYQQCAWVKRDAKLVNYQPLVSSPRRRSVEEERRVA